MKKCLGLTLGVILALVPGAFAQVATGNLYGTVTDESGGVLPGATVTLSSERYGSRTTTTGTQGDFRFLNLDPGPYKVTVGLTGFSTVNRDVVVNTGSNVSVDFNLKVATVQETVTITAETPIVDAKRFGTATTITKEEIASVPNARDPWAMLRTVPGVIMDRVNIGGNENGQQANFVGKGDNGDNAMWNLDGVVITDTGAVGASPTYFDFDAFEEISITTGGNDLRVQTGGIGINLVTRRGTNQFRGSAHGYLTHDDLQSTNIPDELVGDARLQGSDKGDHIQQIGDYGFELGGPIVKDKLWFYGSWGKQDIRLVRINQTSDKTQLTSYNGKINWQASPNDQVSVYYFNGAKTKLGRSVGTGVQEEDSFLWNQDNRYPSWLPGMIKGEINHTFSSNFFASAKYSYYSTGFFLHPRGGDINGTVDFDAGVARGAYLSVDNTRPAHTANVDANYFKAGTGGNHEFKFGFGYRKFNITSTTHWGGNGLFAYNFGGGATYVHVTRDAKNATQADYWSAYLGDSFSKGRLNLNIGVRYDRQTSQNLPAQIPASAALPQILGPINFDGNTPHIEWSDIAPRVGLTVALDQSRKTLLRASYARYASQLPSGQAAFLAPAPSPGAYFAYVWDDVNHDGFAQPNEVRTDLGLQYFNYVNVNDPNGPSPNRLADDYKAQHDDEFLFGFERELMPDLALSAAYSYRRTNDVTAWTPRTGFTTADYAPANFARNGYTAVGYVPNSVKVLANGGSRTLMNRPDYHRNFNGFEVTLLKRLSHRWMARAAFTYNDSTEFIDGPGAISNPSHTDTDVVGNFSPASGPLVDGGAYPVRSAGSGKGDAFINAKWQFVTNALVQLPAGFEVSTALFARQGHPRPVVFRQVLGFEGALRILATENPELDTLRYPSIWNLDFRVAKNFKIGSSTFVASADLFNVFNGNTELSRFRQASSGAFNRLDEILNPRVLRFGLRYQF